MSNKVPQWSESNPAHLVSIGDRPYTLSEFVGKLVTVCVSSVPFCRSGFHTQISVCGELEKHPEKESYRVLCHSGTYAYFTPEDVTIVAAEGHTFKDGSKAVCFMAINTVDDSLETNLDNVTI